MKVVLAPAMEVEYDFTIDLTGSLLKTGDQVFSGDFGMSFIGIAMIEATSDYGDDDGVRRRIGYVKIYPKVDV